MTKSKVQINVKIQMLNELKDSGIYDLGFLSFGFDLPFGPEKKLRVEGNFEL